MRGSKLVCWASHSPRLWELAKDKPPVNERPVAVARGLTAEPSKVFKRLKRSVREF